MAKFNFKEFLKKKKDKTEAKFPDKKKKGKPLNAKAKGKIKKAKAYNFAAAEKKLGVLH